MDLNKFELSLKKLAEENSLRSRRCSEWHFQLEGIFLINIYPTKDKFYIQGTNGCSRLNSLAELVKIAQGTSDNKLKGIKKGVRKSGKSKHARTLLWEDGEKYCFICKEAFNNFNETTLEHKIPLSKGGSNRKDNLALSHHKCNQARGNSISTEVTHVE